LPATLARRIHLDVSRAKKRRYRPILRAPAPLDEVMARTEGARFAKVRPPLTARQWTEVVGGRIASRAEPVRLSDDGELLVRVASSAWASELSLLSGDILARLARLGFQVRSLRFRVGEVRGPERPVERRKTRRAIEPARLPEEVARAVGDVADEELRRVIAESAAMNLGWQDAVAEPTTSAAPRAARVPRDAGTRSAPPGRTAPRKA
jgi:hypothetical protein